jgi:DNA-binding IclR family transcriptional regulator
MSGAIQSIERAAAILELLQQSDRSLQLREISDHLQLSKATTHGIVRTLVTLGYVDQDPDNGSYASGPRAVGHSPAELDGNDLRSVAMPWADTLAAAAGFEVAMALLVGHEAELVHHVFRPDDTPQRLRVGQRIPLHATACGKLLLAYSPMRGRLLRNVSLDRYTRRTSTSRTHLAEEVERIRHSGVAVSDREFEPEVAAVAVPVHGRGRTSSAALAVLGPPEAVLDRDGNPAPAVVDELRHAAAGVNRALEPVR